MPKTRSRYAGALAADVNKENLIKCPACIIAGELPWPRHGNRSLPTLWTLWKHAIPLCYNVRARGSASSPGVPESECIFAQPIVFARLRAFPRLSCTWRKFHRRSWSCTRSETLRRWLPSSEKTFATASQPDDEIVGERACGSARITLPETRECMCVCACQKVTPGSAVMSSDEFSTSSSGFPRVLIRCIYDATRARKGTTWCPSAGIWEKPPGTSLA